MRDFLQDRVTVASVKGSGAPPEAHALSSLESSSRGRHNGSAGGQGCGKEGAKIECVEADGRIEQIIVTCACGERITVQCSY